MLVDTHLKRSPPVFSFTHTHTHPQANSLSKPQVVPHRNHLPLWLFATPLLFSCQKLFKTPTTYCFYFPSFMTWVKGRIQQSPLLTSCWPWGPHPANCRAASCTSGGFRTQVSLRKPHVRKPELPQDRLTKLSSDVLQ